jgi:hypothetical protein
MLIEKTSMISGKKSTLDLPVTEEQIKLWQTGMLIQNAMPQLNETQREFLITGITESEWAEHF